MACHAHSLILPLGASVESRIMILFVSDSSWFAGGRSVSINALVECSKAVHGDPG